MLNKSIKQHNDRLEKMVEDYKLQWALEAEQEKQSNRNELIIEALEFYIDYLKDKYLHPCYYNHLNRQLAEYEPLLQEMKKKVK